MKRCPSCGGGVSARCRTCSGPTLCVLTDSLFERKRGQHCQAECMLCQRVANPPEKPLPLVASRRITPAPIQGEIEREARR